LPLSATASAGFVAFGTVSKSSDHVLPPSTERRTWST